MWIGYSHEAWEGAPRLPEEMCSDVQVVEAATRAAVVRVDGEWVAVTWRAHRPIVLGRSPLASPLVASLRAQGYSPRIGFAWNHPDRYLEPPIGSH
jgi:hypothetical protein